MIGQEIWFFRGKMFYYIVDLLFLIIYIFDSFLQFRKEVECYVFICELLFVLEEMVFIMVKFEEGEIFVFEDFGYVFFVLNDWEGFVWKGGEEVGFEYFYWYIWEQEIVQEYVYIYCGVSKVGYFFCFLVWLVQGCFFFKMVYYYFRVYEQQRGVLEFV